MIVILYAFLKISAVLCENVYLLNVNYNFIKIFLSHYNIVILRFMSLKLYT